MSEPNYRVTDTNRDDTLPPMVTYPTEVTIVRALVDRNLDGTHDYSIAFTTGTQPNFPYRQAIRPEISLAQVLSKMCEFVVATQLSRNTLPALDREASTQDELIGWQMAVQAYCESPDSVVPGITMTYSPNLFGTVVDSVRGLAQIIYHQAQQTTPRASRWPISQEEISSILSTARCFNQLNTQLSLTRASRPEPSLPPHGGTWGPVFSTYPRGVVFVMRGHTGQVQANAQNLQHNIEFFLDEASNL